MATTTVTVTGNIRDLIDAEFDRRRAKVFVVHNTTFIADPDEGVVRLGSASVSPDSDGAFSLPDVIASADTVENLQATVYVDYPDVLTGRNKHKRQSFGPYDLSAETGTVDLTELEETQHLDASFVSVTMTEMQALLDSMTEISGLTGEDAAVGALVAGTGGAGPITRAALSDSYARVAGNIDATVRKLADDNADVHVLVLGDSTAAQTGQFPDELMPDVQALYPHRTLQKATWDNTGHAWGSFSTVGSSGTGSFKIKFWQGAVSGTVCEQPLNYWDDWVAGVQPDLVIVHYGHNYGKNASDGGQPSDTVMDQVFRERYLRFVAEVKKSCPRADVLLVSQNPYLTSGARTDISGIRSQTVREIAADLGCAYGPVYEAYIATGSPSTYLGVDLLHPTTAGAQLAAAALLPLFRVRENHEIFPRLASPLLTRTKGLLTNGDFVEFSPSAAPTGWTKDNVALSKDTTNYESANGYSVKGVCDGVGTGQIYQLLPIRRVAGEIVCLAARFRVPAAQTSGNIGRVQLSGDGMTGVSSGTITSVRDNWVWSFVVARVPKAATYATASVIFGTANGHECSIDRVSCDLGSLPRDVARRDALTTYVTTVETTEDALTTGQMVPRRSLMNSAAVSHSSGTLALSYFTADKTETINNVTVYTGTTAAAATPTLIRVGIYSLDGSGNGTLINSTVNDTTLLAAASTAYTKALSSSFSKVAGTRYAIAVLVVSGSTMPSFQGPLSVASTPSQVAFGLAPRMCGRLTGQTDLPSSFTEAGLTAYSNRSHVLLT